jgi:hypothetical protein
MGKYNKQWLEIPKYLINKKKLAEVILLISRNKYNITIQNLESELNEICIKDDKNIKGFTLFESLIFIEGTNRNFDEPNKMGYIWEYIFGKIIKRINYGSSNVTKELKEIETILTKLFGEVIVLMTTFQDGIDQISIIEINIIEPNKYSLDYYEDQFGDSFSDDIYSVIRIISTPRNKKDIIIYNPLYKEICGNNPIINKLKYNQTILDNMDSNNLNQNRGLSFDIQKIFDQIPENIIPNAYFCIDNNIPKDIITYKYANVYGRDKILKNIGNLISGAGDANKFMSKLYKTGLIAYDFNSFSQDFYRLCPTDEFNYLEKKFDDIIKYNGKRIFYSCYTNDKLYNKIMTRSLNPRLNYVYFTDGGDNYSDMPLLSLHYDFSKSYIYQRHPNFPKKSNDVIIPIESSQLLILKIKIEDEKFDTNNITCLGRTIFVKNEDGSSYAIKIKKQNEDIREINKEKQIINWITDNPKTRSIFKYLSGNEKNRVEIEPVNNLPELILEKLNEQIINSGNGYSLDITDGVYKYITYKINDADVELNELIGFLDSVYNDCYKKNKYTSEKKYNDCVKEVQLSLSKKIETNLESAHFRIYLEEAKYTICSDECFFKKSILNLTQLGKLVSNGFVHASLINMFHNVQHNRRFITIANLLDVQENRRGIGRLSNIFDSSLFSNFRWNGIADFAEISTLDELKEMLLSTLNTTNINNHLSMTLNPDKFVELEALQSQYFSWFIILLRKVFIVDKKVDKQYLKNLLYEGMAFYISAYLNKDTNFTKNLINELGLKNNFEIVINQIEYFLSRDFPKDLRNNVNDYVIEKLYKNKIFERHTEIKLPELVSPNEINNMNNMVYDNEFIDYLYSKLSFRENLAKYLENRLESEFNELRFFANHRLLVMSDRLDYNLIKQGILKLINENNDYKELINNLYINDSIERLSNTNPRGWATVIIVNKNTILKVDYLGWFYFLSMQIENSNKLILKTDKLQEIIGYTLDARTIRKENEGIVLVIDTNGIADTPETIVDNLWMRLYPKIDAGAVNGSIPYQEIFNIMNILFFYAIELKNYNREMISKKDLDNMILNNYINKSDRLNKNNFLNKLWMDIIGTIGYNHVLKTKNNLSKPIIYKNEIILNLRISELFDKYLINTNNTKIDVNKLLCLINIILTKIKFIGTQNIKRISKIITNLIISNMLPKNHLTTELLVSINKHINNYKMMINAYNQNIQDYSNLENNIKKIFKSHKKQPNRKFDFINYDELYEVIYYNMDMIDIKKSNIIPNMSDEILFDKLFVGYKFRGEPDLNTLIELINLLTNVIKSTIL